MAMMEQRPWTNERLDDLKAAVGEGFKENRTEFRSVREEMVALRQEIRADSRATRAEIAALERATHQFMFALVGTIFLGFMGTITAIVTQT
jgi:Spy/CpxP family protein refolding chaperone